MAEEQTAQRTEGDIISAIEVYMTVENASEAIAFYQKAFGAKVTYKELTPDGARVQHASLAAFGGHFMLSDYFPDYSTDVAPRAPEGKGAMTVQINLASPLEVDGAIARAVGAGATVTAPAADTFWVMRYGRIRDPFGYVWAFSAPLPLGP